MTDIVQLPDPHLTLVPGFRATGVACGLKKDNELDLALISADAPCTAGAVFTRNRVQAAPVLYDRALIAKGTPICAVVINSGRDGTTCTTELPPPLDGMEGRATLVTTSSGKVMLACNGALTGEAPEATLRGEAVDPFGNPCKFVITKSGRFHASCHS